MTTPPLSQRQPPVSEPLFFYSFFIILILSAQINSSFALSSGDIWPAPFIFTNSASWLKPPVQSTPSLLNWFQSSDDTGDDEDPIESSPLSTIFPFNTESGTQSPIHDYEFPAPLKPTIPKPGLHQSLPGIILKGLSEEEQKQFYLEWLEFVENFILFVTASSTPAPTRKKTIINVRRKKRKAIRNEKKHPIKTLPIHPVKPVPPTPNPLPGTNPASHLSKPVSAATLSPASKKTQETDKKETLNQGVSTSASPIAKSKSSKKKKTSDNPRIKALKDTLEELLKKHIETRKQEDQHPLLQEFYGEITASHQFIPRLQEYFHSDSSDGIRYEMLSPPAILLLLENRFHNAMTNAQVQHDAISETRLKYILLNPEVRTLTQSFLMPYLGLETDNETLFHHIVNNFPDEHRQAVPRLTLPRSLFSLTAFFAVELYKMELLQNVSGKELTRLYVIDNYHRHKVLVYVRRKLDNTIRVMISDSLRSFPGPAENLIGNMDSNIIALSLMTAFEDSNITVSGAQFFYFPEGRQKDVMGCLAFIFQDIEVLLSQPPGPGYKVLTSENLPMAVWTPWMVDIAKQEIRGFAENTSDLSQMRGPEETGRLETILRRMTHEHLAITGDTATINSHKYVFKRLTRYPTRLLTMTQSRTALNELIEDMLPSDQAQARKSAAESYGLMTVDGELKTEYNFAAQQYYLELIIELLGLLIEKTR